MTIWTTSSWEAVPAETHFTQAQPEDKPRYHEEILALRTPGFLVYNPLDIKNQLLLIRFTMSESQVLNTMHNRVRIF
jgi:hypothetical protein